MRFEDVVFIVFFLFMVGFGGCSIHSVFFLLIVGFGGVVFMMFSFSW